MDKLRQAAQRLIDRIDLEGATPLDWHEYDALRAALAEQPAEQEPYCYVYTENGEEYFAPPTAYVPDNAKPLYTAPQPHREVELTDEDIERALDAANVPELPDGYESLELEFARAIIAAIKERLK